MKRTMLALAIVMTSTGVFAQEPFSPAPVSSSPSPSDLQFEQTPEFYMFMKMMERYDSPKQAVRRKAEQKAAERRGRLASQKWYGYSQSRPAANPLPWMSTYGQQWVGNGGNPYHWVQYWPTTVRIETVTR